MIKKEDMPEAMTSRKTVEKRLISINELAALTGLSKGTLYQWVSRKKGIPYVKVGRLTKFDLKDVEKWIEEHKVHPNKI